MDASLGEMSRVCVERGVVDAVEAGRLRGEIVGAGQIVSRDKSQGDTGLGIFLLRVMNESAVQETGMIGQSSAHALHVFPRGADKLTRLVELAAVNRADGIGAESYRVS